VNHSSQGGLPGKGRILHILDHSFPITDGYAFRSAQIMRFEQANRWQVEALTSAKQGELQERIEIHEGLVFHRTPVPRQLHHHLPLMDQWGIVTSLKARLREVIAEFQPDILHVHSPALNGLAACSVGRRMRIPVVYEIRAFWEDAAVDSGACREGDLRYRVTRAMESRVCRKADHVVTICNGLRDDLIARGFKGDKISVVANAVDIERFTTEPERDARLSEELGLRPGKTLGFIGSFYAFEGLQVLIEAMPEILKQDPDVRLLLVGGGVEERTLQRQSQRLGLEGRIIFTGRVPHQDVERYYGLIDLLIYPRVSMRITELVTPLKPLEAMAQGKPVLASDVGGHRELIDDAVTGTLFEAGDPSALATAALAILSEPEKTRRICDAARQMVSSQRCWKDNVKRYDDIYSKLPRRQGRGKTDVDLPQRTSPLPPGEG